MISARFFLAGEQYTGCEISGHADYSEEGTDVICAYVSATVQTVANLMTEIFRLPVSAAEQEEPALVSIQLKEPDPSGNVQRLFAGLELQLGERVKTKVNEEEARITLHLPATCEDEDAAQAVLTGMMLTLCSLRDEYPDHIEVLEV